MNNFDKYVSSLLNEEKEEDQIPGGMAAGKSCEEIAKKHGVSKDAIEKQVEMGAEVEKEHTNSEEKAEEIARDHLWEIPDYYTRLAKMEADAKKTQSGKKKLKTNESNVAGGAGSAFGNPSAYNIGDFGGSVGNNDFYGPGDARMPKSIFGKVLRRNMNSTSTSKKKRKKKQYGRKKES